jgi:hypothetical protein
MTDIVTHGVERTTGSPPFPEPASKVRAESDAPDVVHRGVDNPIEGGSDEERVRASVRELNKQREWESGIGGDDPFAEQRAPVLERKYDGRDRSSKSLRETTSDISNAHRMEKVDTHLAVHHFGGDPEAVLERVKDPAFIRQMQPTWTRAEAEHFARTGEQPPMPIGVADEHRGIANPLRDHEPILGRPAHEALNLREATRQTGNYRELLAFEMSRQQMADMEAANLAIEQQQAKPQEAAKPVAEQAPQPAPQQPPRTDLLQAERQRLTWEAQAHAALRQSSVQELQAVASAEQIVAAFPELKSEAAIRDTYARNPQRFQQLQQAAQALTNCQQQFARANEARSVREAQLQQAENAHINAVYRHY